MITLAVKKDGQAIIVTKETGIPRDRKVIAFPILSGFRCFLDRMVYTLFPITKILFLEYEHGFFEE